MSESIFNLVPSSKKWTKQLSLKLRDSDLDNFFEDGSKLKIPCEITPPLLTNSWSDWKSVWKVIIFWIFSGIKGLATVLKATINNLFQLRLFEIIRLDQMLYLLTCSSDSFKNPESANSFFFFVKMNVVTYVYSA